MTWTPEDFDILHRCPYRNEPAWYLVLTTAERNLLDKLRPSTSITDRDRERLRALVARLEGTHD